MGCVPTRKSVGLCEETYCKHAQEQLAGSAGSTEEYRRTGTQRHVWSAPTDQTGSAESGPIPLLPERVPLASATGRQAKNAGFMVKTRKAMKGVGPMEVTVYNMDGKSVGTMNVDAESLGGEVNPALIKQAYVHYHANLRQGSARTLSRSDVAGSTKKMGKQKGSGGARHGTKRAPIYRGGGHTFAKKKTREDYHLSMPKKMKRKANRNALLAKLIDNEVKVVDSLAMSEPKTSVFRTLLKNLGVDRTVLVALRGGTGEDGNTKLSARNIDDVTICRADQLTCFQMLNCRYMVIEKSQLEAWLAGPSSQTGMEAKVNPMGRENGSN